MAKASCGILDRSFINVKNIHCSYLDPNHGAAVEILIQIYYGLFEFNTVDTTSLR